MDADVCDVREVHRIQSQIHLVTASGASGVYKCNVESPATKLVHLASMAFVGRSMGVSVALLAVLCVFAQRGRATRFVVKNQCSYTVWAAGSPVGGGRELRRGQSWTVQVPAGTRLGRFWGRTGCRFDASGRGSCRTGDCGGLLNCQGYGNVPATLAEYALNQFSNLDFYDISLVDGFNVPLSIVPTNGRCKPVLCNRDINSKCPAALKVPDGCKSACAAFNTPQYCCTGPFEQKCDPTDYSRFFKAQCPDAYSYAKDDQTSTFTCPSGTTDYQIIFCGPSIRMVTENDTI